MTTGTTTENLSVPASIEILASVFPNGTAAQSAWTSILRVVSTEGAYGEIVSHGPQITLGYWNRPEETAAAFIELDGKRFFRTGDLARYDEEGYFFMVDRIKRMINASGFKVWPSEVENMMYQNPLVKEGGIISSPHPKRGETVKACIVLSPEANPATAEQEIISWCKAEMATYKVPEIVEFVSELPKSPSGKLMWRELQEQEWRKAAS